MVQRTMVLRFKNTKKIETRAGLCVCVCFLCVDREPRDPIMAGVVPFLHVGERQVPRQKYHLPAVFELPANSLFSGHGPFEPRGVISAGDNNKAKFKSFRAGKGRENIETYPPPQTYLRLKCQPPPLPSMETMLKSPANVCPLRRLKICPPSFQFARRHTKHLADRHRF